MKRIVPFRSIVFALAALFASSVSAQDIPATRMPDKSKTPGHATYQTEKTVCARKTVESAAEVRSLKGVGGCGTRLQRDFLTQYRARE